MADISKIIAPNGAEYNLKDAEARAGKKSLQTAVSDPAASGTGIEFISGITQDANGVITPMKQTVRTMQGGTSTDSGTSGLVPTPPATTTVPTVLSNEGQWIKITAGNEAISIGQERTVQPKRLVSISIWLNTNYTARATRNGLMSSADKVKLDAIALTPSEAIFIPLTSSGAVRYDMEGLTASHEVIRWNFSSSAENLPPCDLTITTYDGYFTVTNTSGTTNESIRPVFAIPSAVTATEHTS